MSKVQIRLERLKQLEKLKSSAVNIGIKSGATYSTGEKVSDVATLLENGWTQKVSSTLSAYFHSLGVPIKKGTTLRSPPRPFFQWTFSAKKSEWLKTAESLLKNISDNPKAKVRKSLSALGALAVGDIKEAMQVGSVGGNVFPERSNLTMLLLQKQAQGHRVKGGNIARRKSLINTGTLLGSIDYEIKEE